MKLTDDQIKMMQEDMASSIIALLMKDRKLPLEEALAILYKSRMFKCLMDKNTGLYYQSPGYAYDVLKDETR